MRPLDKKLLVIAHEAFVRRKFVVTAFFAVVALSLIVGWAWPARYTSSATIIVDEKNIIQPLMNGAAVPTDVVDRARLARDIINSRKIMNKVIDAIGLANKDMSPVERERVMDMVRRQTNITNIGTNLIRIEYRDTDPDLAYRVNGKLVESFITENIGTKAKESESAFHFIDEQVRQYQEKLAQAETSLRRFRAGANIPRGRNDAMREDSLFTRAEQTRGEIKEAEIRRAALDRQLAGEARSAIDGSQERELRARLTTLQNQLTTLRLTYQDTYPDIVRIRKDIADVRKELAKEQQSHTGSSAVLDEASASQFRQRLMEELSMSDAQIASLRTRLAETERLIESEREQGKIVTPTGVTLADLMRDYEVSQSILDDLLKRREAARVSMNLDLERQGLSFRIHDDASLPISPSGPRFMHFTVGGLLLGLLAPFGLLYAKQELDDRIRFHGDIQEKLGVPVISVVPHLSSPDEKVQASRALQWLVILAFTVIFVIMSVIFVGSDP